MTHSAFALGIHAGRNALVRAKVEALLISKRYTNSNKTGLLGTQVLSFAIQPETSTTALLKLIEVEKDNAGNTTSTSTITFRLTPAGSMTRLSETTVSGTTALTLTYL